jgi:hypothetical protein
MNRDAPLILEQLKPDEIVIPSAPALPIVADWVEEPHAVRDRDIREARQTNLGKNIIESFQYSGFITW